MLADMKYSRDFERDADRHAFRTLSARGLSPCILGQFLTRLAGRTSATSLWPAIPAAKSAVTRWRTMPAVTA
jgi:predicted Zn-dependent protease